MGRMRIRILRELRRVIPTGITFNGKTYYSPSLFPHLGQKVLVCMARTENTLRVMKDDGKKTFICDAELSLPVYIKTSKLRKPKGEQ